MVYITIPILISSWWPFLVSIRRVTLLSRILLLFLKGLWNNIILTFILITILRFIWWKDLIKERDKGGHRQDVISILKWGIILFILREVIFFFRWFWGYFHNITLSNVEGIISVNPATVPTLNTLILLSRGLFVTLFHHLFLEGKKRDIIILFGIIYGLLFTSLQGIEYFEILFSTRDSFFGRSFFITTGFHGIHVIVGTIFLFIIWLRRRIYSLFHRVGLECRLWYWHFVDVVWLFLYIFIYWW